MDIDLIRQETKGCTDKIFLNSAGSSLVNHTVTNKMVGYLTSEALIGGYALANQMDTQVNEFYTEAAILLNCSPENIAYTSSATDAYARAITSVNFNSGDVILTTDDDYISNQLSFLSLKQRYSIILIRAKNLSNGDLDLESFENLIKQHRPKLVALTHIPTNSGLVQQAEEVGELCRKYDVLYLLDACQSVGQIVVDVQKIGCDFLTATGRKFLRGPRGTGLLYVSNKVLSSNLVPLIFDMQGADWTGIDEYQLVKTAKRFEFWESSIACKIGLATAIKYANSIQMANIEAYNKGLVKQFRSQLLQVKGLHLHDNGTRLSNIITFTIENRSIQQTAQLLRDNNVYFSVSLKDFALIDFTKKNIDGVIRFSPHYFNTVDELKKIITILNS